MARLIEATTLEELGLRVGFLHIPGVGFRIGTASGDGFSRHYSLAAARRLARELEDAGEQDLAGVPPLLREKADRLERFLAGEEIIAPLIDEVAALGAN